MNKLCLSLAITASIFSAAFSGIFSSAALATEGGGNSYPLGVETNFSGLMRPEGLTTYLYLQHYTADHLKGNDGHDNPAIQDFNLESNAMSLRLTYVWPGVKFLGANVETRAAQVFVSLSRDLAVQPPGAPAVVRSSNQLDSLGDFTLMPIGLGWHSATFHQTAAIEGFLPTGDYDKNRTLNVGRNYYQVAPFYAFTWIPNSAIDVSAKLRYAFNTENHDTNYRSGDELTLEYNAGYALTPKFQLGVNGYVYRQESDDRQNHADVNGNGNRGEVDGLGPYMRIAFTPTFRMLFKYEHEFDARNKTEGDRVWIQTILPF
jgi:hypothetical protein